MNLDRHRSTAFPAVALALLGSLGCVGYRTPLDELPDAGIPCKPGSFGLTRTETAVVFLLDRSTSMEGAMETGRRATRWTALSSALAQVLPPVDQAMAIGALLFPSVSADSASCTVPSKPDLSPAIGNVAALTRLMNGSSPGGSTPTVGAIDVAAGLVLGLRTAKGGRALVLATDGGPDCNIALNPATCRCADGRVGNCARSQQCLDDDRAVKTIAKYAQQGLPTYVVGIESAGDDSLSDVLEAMAIAGGRPQTGAARSYYSATSESALDAALTTIRDQVGACTFLTTSVPDANGTIVISLDGTELGADEWTWRDRANGEIMITGDACQRSEASATPALTAVVQCNEG